MNDAEARREFEVARRIHTATDGGREHLEIVDEIIGESIAGKASGTSDFAGDGGVSGGERVTRVALHRASRIEESESLLLEKQTRSNCGRPWTGQRPMR